VAAEPPRPSRFPVTALLPVAIVLLAAALRLVGLHWGLPDRRHFFSYHPDEIFLLMPSVQSFAHGDWNPHFFNYGSLYLYLVGIPAVLSGVVHAASLAPLYLLGRTITAVLGIGTVAALYLALRREDRSLALVSALLLAVLPLHVINSHYATVDVPATFFLVLAFAFALRSAQKPSLVTGLCAGLFVGLGAATKYNAGLFLVPVLLAPLLAPPRQWRTSWLGSVLLGAAVGFTLGCPYFWTPDFRRGLLFEAQHMREGGTFAFTNAGAGWVYHLLHGLPVALSLPLLVAVVLGIYVAFRLPSRAVRLSLLWVILYLFVIGFAKEWFIRYLLPLTPFLAVLAGSGLLWLWRAPRAKALRAAGAAVGLAVVGLTLLYTWGQTQLLTGEDPRDRAWSSVGPVVMLSRGRVAVGLVSAPWFYSPPVAPYNAGEATRRYFDELMRETHTVVTTGWDPAVLRAARPELFFLSDLESRDLLRRHDPAAVSFVQELGALYPYTCRFSRPPAPGAWLAPGRDWAPPDWLYSSPIITLYCSAESPDDGRLYF